MNNFDLTIFHKLPDMIISNMNMSTSIRCRHAIGYQMNCSHIILVNAHSKIWRRIMCIYMHPVHAGGHRLMVIDSLDSNQMRFIHRKLKPGMAHPYIPMNAINIAISVETHM